MLSIVIYTPGALEPINLRDAVHYATGIYTESNDYLAQTRILAVCGGLLEFGDSDSSSATEWASQSTPSVKHVRLAHRSVFSFLSTFSPETTRATESDGTAITGHMLLLRACIKALIEFLDKVAINSEENTLMYRGSSQGNTIAWPNPGWFHFFALKWWLSCAQKPSGRPRRLNLF